MKRSLLIGLLCVMALACRSDAALTQIMVVVRSDIELLQSVEIRVDGLGPSQTAKASLAEKKLPRTLAVVHRGGSLGPITISAFGSIDGTVVVSRTARVSFARDKNVTLLLDLVHDCEGITCPDSGETCIAHACESSSVDVDTLEPWSGSVQDLGDAGVASDAGEGLDATMSLGDSGADATMMGVDASEDASMPGCTTGNEDCDHDGQCDALTTLENCGACGETCGFDAIIADGHANLSCKSGACAQTCKAGYVDFDGEVGNGCEARAFATDPAHVDPSAEDLRMRATTALRVDCNATLAFGSGEVMDELSVCGQKIHPLVVEQTDGPDLVVVPLLGLNVMKDRKLGISGTRPVVLVVFGDATVAGTIDVGAMGAIAGPGGNVSCDDGQGSTGTSSGGGTGSGGGGGGFGSAGGDGGDNASSGAKGAASGGTEGSLLLDVLRGGCSGGRGGGNDGGLGGGGGGAVQLSASGTLTVSGVIAAAGGGGRAPISSNQGGGGGGGSGGAVLLEASQLMLGSSARLTANGGAGGEASTDNYLGMSGADGAAATSTAAIGGSGGSSSAGNGGSGAAGVSAAGQGTDGSGLSDAGGGGGGGGGGGRIALHGTSHCVLDGLTSPTASKDCPP